MTIAEWPMVIAVLALFGLFRLAPWKKPDDHNRHHDQPMADPHVIAALVKRRGELTGLDAIVVRFQPDHQVEERPCATLPSSLAAQVFQRP
jgi:hypothetical protein